MAQWLNIDSTKIKGDCGSSGGFTLAVALNGTSLWKHTVDHTHWFALDLGGMYEITKVRGRSMTRGEDPTRVTIYVAEVTETWGVAVTSDITVWQNTNSWRTVITTTKTGRYVMIVISNTESPARYLSFGSASPFPIFDVYGERVPVDVNFKGDCISEIEVRGRLIGIVGMPFTNTIHVGFTTKEAILGGFIPLAGDIFASTIIEGTFEVGVSPEHYVLTFFDVELCPGGSWPGSVNLNQSWLLLPSGPDSFSSTAPGPSMNLYFGIGDPPSDVVSVSGVGPEFYLEEFFSHSGAIPRFSASLRGNELAACTGWVRSIHGEVMILPSFAPMRLAGEIFGQSSIAPPVLKGIIKDLEATNVGIIYSTSRLKGIIKDIRGVNTGIIYSISELLGFAVNFKGSVIVVSTAKATLRGIVIPMKGSIAEESFSGG